MKLSFHLGFKLDPGEEVLRIIHRHPFDLIPALLSSIAIAGGAVALALLWDDIPSYIPFPNFILLPLVLIMLSLSVMIFLIGIYVYQRNYLVFTNIHYVQVEQIGLFGHRVSQLSFLRVEDVTGKRAGLLGTIFNFGEVRVQSAAEHEEFVFINAPRPADVADDALQTHERCMQEATRHGHPVEI